MVDPLGPVDAPGSNGSVGQGEIVATSDEYPDGAVSEGGIVSDGQEMRETTIFPEDVFDPFGPEYVPANS